MALENPFDSDPSKRFEISWDNTELRNRKAKCLYVEQLDDVSDTVAALKLDQFVSEVQGWKHGVQGVINVIGNTNLLENSIEWRKLFDNAVDAKKKEMKEARGGGEPDYAELKGLVEGEYKDKKPAIELSAKVTADEAESRLKMMFSRGIVRAALNVHAAIFTAGCDKGPVRMVGNSARDRDHRLPLIGVVPHGAVTYPGDDRSNIDARQADQLQPDHTHLVCLNTNEHQDSAQYRFEMIEKLIKKDSGPPLPAAALCCSGGEPAIFEVLQCARRGWPVVVVKGSGGAADAIAWVCNPDNRSFFIPNPHLMEIAREVKVELIDLENVDGKITQAMLERLFNTMLVERSAKKGESGPVKSQNVVLAWEQIVVYKSNAKALKAKEDILQTLILVLNVLLTTMVVVKADLNTRGIRAPVVTHTFDYPVLFLPIIISVLLGIINRFQFGLKSKILTAGAELILAEIYKYRTATGVYGEKADFRMGEFLRSIVEGVTATPVGEMSMSRTTLESMRQGQFFVSPEDNGFSPLSPDQYINLRLQVKLMGYGRSTLSNAKMMFRYRSFVFVMGAIGTVIAGARLSIYVAVSTALATAVQAIIEKGSFSKKLVAHNRCAGELTNTKAWWKARTQIEQANPQKFAELVRQVEMSLSDELQATNPTVSQLLQTSVGIGQLDVEGLIDDIQQNIEEGKIVFSNNWMDKYSEFFEGYNEWFGEQHNLRIKGSHIDNDLKPLMEDSNYTDVTLYESPQSERFSDANIVREYNFFDILWDPDSFSLRTSTVVEMRTSLTSASVAQVCAGLGVEKSFMKGRPISGCITIIGASDSLDKYLMEGSDSLNYKLPDHISPEEAIARLRMVYSRGIVAAAQSVGAVIITSGLDAGPSGYMGMAVADRFYPVPVVGVVSKNKMSWPGDERPGMEGRLPLQPDHTHYVMLPSNDDASATDFRFKLANYYTKNGELPSVAFVVNGGKTALNGVLASVRLGWPIVVVKGTGGLADRIAEAKSDPNKFFSDPQLTEIIQEGNIEFIELSEVDGGVSKKMIERLFATRGMDNNKGGNDGDDDDYDENPVDPMVAGLAEGIDLGNKLAKGGLKALNEPEKHTLGPASYKGEPKALSLHQANAVMAWDKQVTCDDNATKSKSWANFFRDVILVLGIVSTCIATIVEYLKTLQVEEDKDFAPPLLYLRTVLFCIPILVSVIIALENESRFGLKGGMLKSSSEVILSHIYQYRTGSGDYSGSLSAKNTALTQVLKLEGDKLQQSGVGEMGLSTELLTQKRQYGFVISAEDDGFSTLTPEDYVNLRLETLSKHYEGSSVETERKNNFYNICVYFLGGIGTALAIVDETQIFVAVTTAISAAVVTLMEKEKYDEKLFVFNRSIAQITSVLTWWRSLSPIEKANPQKFTKLVSDTEAVKGAELRSLAPNASGSAEGQNNLGEQLNLVLFKQDLTDAINSRGSVEFRRTWCQRHGAFFDAYVGWTYTMNMWEKVPDEDIIKLRKPPIADDIKTDFLETSVISILPIQRGRELLTKWCMFHNNGERSVAAWYELGPQRVPHIGSGEERMSGLGGGGQSNWYGTDAPPPAEG